jgi:hypothetical protein
MARASLEERLAQAKERAQRWRGESQRLEGVQRMQARKDDTRRKIIAGDYFLKRIASDAGLREEFVRELRARKLRKGERELFADLLGEPA